MFTERSDAEQEPVLGAQIKDAIENAFGSEVVQKAVSEKAVIVVVTIVVHDCVIEKD